MSRSCNAKLVAGSFTFRPTLRRYRSERCVPPQKGLAKTLKYIRPNPLEALLREERSISRSFVARRRYLGNKYIFFTVK